jgi:hypothetical protein
MTTWPAAALADSVVDRSRPPPDKKRDAIETARYVSTFVADLLRDELFCEKQDRGRGFATVDGGPIPHDKLAFWQRSVVTSEGYLRVQPNYPRTNPVSKTKYHLATKEAADEILRTGSQEVADPRRFFIAAGRWFWDYPVRLAGMIEKDDSGRLTYKVELAERADLRLLVVTRTMSRGSDTMTGRIEYALNRGGNPVTERETINGALKSVQEWQYAEQQGVFIPSTHSLTQYAPDGKTVRTRLTSTLRDCKLNEPVDRDMFTWKGLGLRDGDRLEDKLSGVTYCVFGGKLVSETPASKNPDNRPTPPAVERPTLPALVAGEDGRRPSRGADTPSTPARQSPWSTPAVLVGAIALLALAAAGIALWRVRRQP